jgi:hypothetical protein
VSEALYGSPPATGRVGAPYDPDQLLAGYRAAWAQKPLFDARSGGSGPAAYDEFVDAAGNVRPGRRELAEIVGERGRAGLDPVELAAGVKPGGTRGISSPRVLSDLFWVGRYAERAEGTARLLTVTRERYHEFHHRKDTDGGQCLPVLLGALGQVTGTDTAGVDAETTLWSLTADPERPGSLAQSVERLGLAARAVRDQMSKDTWMVLGSVERALAQLSAQPVGESEASEAADDSELAAVHAMADVITATQLSLPGEMQPLWGPDLRRVVP